MLIFHVLPFLSFIHLENAAAARKVSLRCTRHVDCHSCLQDPCSRRLSHFPPCDATESCSWCPDLHKCYEANYAALYINQSQCDDMKEDYPGQACAENGSSTHQEGTPQKEANCRILGEDWAVELPNFDISHYFRSSNALAFQMTLNLCQVVSRYGEVEGKCGSNVELQVIEIIDACTPKPSLLAHTQDNSQSLQYCWSIPQAKHPYRYFNDKASPIRGAGILFGNLSCCPSNATTVAKPGTNGWIPIRLLLKPPKKGCNGHDHSAIVQSNDFHTMFNCSSLQEEYFDIVVETSRLCPENIDYALDVNQTNLTCHVDKMNGIEVLNCTVYPYRRNGSSVSEFVCSLNHFQVLSRSSGGSDSQYLSELSVNNTNRCTFSLPIDGLKEVIVIYSFEPFVSVWNISGSPYYLPQSQCLLPLYSYILIGIGALVCVISVSAVVCYVRSKHGKTSIDNGKGRASSELQHQPGKSGNSETCEEQEKNIDPRKSFMESKESGQGAPAAAASRDIPTRYLFEKKPLVKGQLVSKDDFVVEGKYDVCLIRRHDDAAWVAEHLKPLFEHYDLAVYDIHTPKEEADLGRLLPEFIGSAINSSSCFLIVCSSEQSGDFQFKYAVSRALQKAVEKNETEEKLRVILVNECKDSIPEDLQIFTCVDWAEESQRLLLEETFKLIAKKVEDS